MNPLLLVDFYKPHHHNMYCDGCEEIDSNLTPRKSRIPGINGVVVFGVQHFIIKYLINQFQTEFFDIDIETIVKEYREVINIDTKHIEKLHALGYLPLEIKSLPEGVICPIGVPLLTIRNTVAEFYWLTNYLETLMSCELWQPITSATIAHEYHKLLSKYALETTGDVSFVQWQGHDFSLRGMSSVESGILSGMGHLLSFTGTDTIPAIYELKKYYGATGLIGASVPATEHSVMCMGTKGDEIGTFRSLLRKYPTGILSVVSDTWDLWKVCTEYLVEMKDEILARDGKLVIRPDSGDPIDIICGRNKQFRDETYEGMWLDTPENSGVVELLWKVFGGTVNEQGYKVLDPHIGAIYGDSITLDRAEQICERLKAKGFASTNIILGIGSYTYQYNTRDTFGFAVKATNGVVNGEEREIFKDPITDDGTKKSAKGLLRVDEVMEADSYGKLHHKTYKLVDQQTREEFAGGALKIVFLNGKSTNFQTLDEIRARLAKFN